MIKSRDNWIYLRDGRRLGYLPCGDETGHAVFYCHGFPGSRLEVLMADRMAACHSIRLIGIDRPGYGLSDTAPGRSLISWSDDLAQLADHLGASRFSVLGVSGGGPYAVACAFMLPSRLSSVALICGLAPIDTAGILSGMTMINHCGLRLSAEAPSLLHTVLAPISILLRRKPAVALSIMAARAKPPDRSFLRRYDIHTMLCATFREAMCNGASGAVSDLRLYGAAWGFRLDRIQVPIDLWHGEKDRIVPVAMGRWLEAAIPGCHATFLPKHGHFSLILEEMPSILGKIAARNRT